MDAKAANALRGIASWVREADGALLLLERGGVVWFYGRHCPKGIILVNVSGDLGIVEAFARDNSFRRLVEARAEFDRIMA